MSVLPVWSAQMSDKALKHLKYFLGNISACINHTVKYDLSKWQVTSEFYNKFMSRFGQAIEVQFTVNSPIEAPPPIKAPPPFGPKPTGFLVFWFLAISQPKVVRFSICKKSLEGDTVLSLMVAPSEGFPTRPAPLLGNLR